MFRAVRPDPVVVQDHMGATDKRKTLVAVNGNPYTTFTSIPDLELLNAMCPLTSRLVVRYDLDVHISWRKIVLKWVTLTSSLSYVPNQEIHDFRQGI